MHRHLIIHVAVLASLIVSQIVWTQYYHPQWPTSIANSLLFTSLVFSLLIWRTPMETWQPLSYRLEQCTRLALAGFGVAFLIIVLFRLDYSRPIFLFGSLMAVLWFYLYHLWCSQKISTTLYFVGAISESYAYNPNRITLKPYTDDLQLQDLASGIVVDLHNPIDEHHQRLLADCALSGIPVIHSKNLEEHVKQALPLSHLSENTLGTLEPNPNYFQAKRLLDGLLILMLLPLWLPLSLVIGMTILVIDGGPVFYTQTRLGYRNRPFTIYKFKSMAVVDDATPAFATEQTERISRLGKWLRRTHLDELPQIWNVIKGDMSIIGPRPEQPEFALDYEKRIPFYNYRHTVKPGITGWAQVNLGYVDNLASTEKKLAFDLYYLKHFGWSLDCAVLLRTLWVVLTKKESR